MAAARILRNTVVETPTTNPIPAASTIHFRMLTNSTDSSIILSFILSYNGPDLLAPLLSSVARTKPAPEL